MARILIALALGVVAGTAHADAPVTLRETVAPGDLSRVTIALAVEGKLKVDRNGKSEAIPLMANAAVGFSERVESLATSGRAGRVTRSYSEARSISDTGLERATHTLGADRRVICTTATPFSPDGPLTRDELELVGEHFDPRELPALLPPNPVTKGATWAIPADAAQHLLQFAGLIKSDLKGTLAELTDAVATITVAGDAEGLENGAAAKVKVSATVTFDRKLNRVTRVEWTQRDARSQGPASPAAELTAKITLTRAPLTTEPTELTAGRQRIPADGKATGVNALLRYADDQGRYQFIYSRQWHVVGRTADHLTLRLIEDGQFVAQATVTAWKPAAAGSHVTPQEFQALLAKLPGWVPTAVALSGEVPTDAGRWLYRVAAVGTQDGQAVAQTFYLLAGPGGDQVAVTILAKPESAAKLGARDAELVNAIEFPARK